jgi:hypothetical protein
MYSTVQCHVHVVEEINKCLGGSQVKMVSRDISREEWIHRDIEPNFSKCGVHIKVDERSNPKPSRNHRKDPNPNPSTCRRHLMTTLMGRLNKDMLLVGIYKALKEEDMD